MLHKLGVTIKNLDAINDIAEVDSKCLTFNSDRLGLKWWGIGYLFINDGIELQSSLVQQVKFFCHLDLHEASEICNE